MKKMIDSNSDCFCAAIKIRRDAKACNKADNKAGKSGQRGIIAPMTYFKAMIDCYE
ncbi:hypothetical protein [Undibacterium pigrum]|uniref:hypothetical protein n=1 Tax=Undibacterium pigrum TaxID=401470 RepID=UPI00147623E4|nr:hypothetical protein [Undibacterium pigrum]